MARIVGARLAHREEDAAGLELRLGSRYGRGQIERVLRGRGLLKPRPPRGRPDPDHCLAESLFRIEIARTDLRVTEIAREQGLTGPLADVERARRALAKAERKAERWREEARKAKP